MRPCAGCNGNSERFRSFHGLSGSRGAGPNSVAVWHGRHLLQRMLCSIYIRYLVVIFVTTNVMAWDPYIINPIRAKHVANFGNNYDLGRCTRNVGRSDEVYNARLSAHANGTPKRPKIRGRAEEPQPHGSEIIDFPFGAGYAIWGYYSITPNI